MNKHAFLRKTIGLMTAMLMMSIAVPVLAQEVTTISTAADLSSFCQAVNGGNDYAGTTVTLANDITCDEWNTSIGAVNATFAGTFDGGGHAIMITNATANLFYNVGSAGTVQNLGVKVTVTGDDAAGIVTINDGMISKCYTEGTIMSNSGTGGGIAGTNQGTIENCYSIASVSVSAGGYGGGIAGQNNSGTIQQCYATGAISGTTKSYNIGGIVGKSYSGTVSNCIALNTSITGGSARGRISGESNSVLSSNYASPIITGTWSNKATDKPDGADLTSATFIGTGAGSGIFASWEGTTWEFGDNSNLPCLKGFNSAQTAGSMLRSRRMFISEISSPDDLSTFRNAVNSGESYEGQTVTLADNINLTGDWTPIGSSSSNPFKGTFEGNGNSIGNLSVTINKAGEQCGGLFGCIGAEATVRNLGLTGTTTVSVASTDNYAYAGGIAGRSEGTIKNCFTTVNVTASTAGAAGYDSHAGGIAGSNSSDISNCYATGDITSGSYAGGIAGSNNNVAGSTVSYCFATGSVNGQSAAGIAYKMGSITHCIALNKKGITCIQGGEKNRVSANGGQNNYASPAILGEWSEKEAGKPNGADLTTDNFTDMRSASGAFEGWSTGNNSWNLINDKLPTLKTAGLTPNIEVRGQGTMPARADYVPTPITIPDEAQLRSFRNAVNGGNTFEGRTVILENDITLTDWTTGIGSDQYPFYGTFDGQGKKITLTGSGSLFTQLGTSQKKVGTIKNLGVKVTITAASGLTAGIVGTNYGTVEQCYTEGTISGDFAGGIAGQNRNVISNCYSTVSITATSGAGGIAENNSGTIDQCYATGAISASGTTSTAGGIAGSNTGKIEKCIALNTSIKGNSSNRIAISQGQGQSLSGNYARPHIFGTWNDKGDAEKDGADLTNDNFIGANTAFAGWDNNWNITAIANLPTLMTTGLTPNIAIKGQSTTPRAGFLKITIGTATDLATFRDAVNTGTNTYEGSTVTLTASIDLKNETWKSIGTKDKPFKGSFDGDAKYISNLKVDLKGNGVEYGGLFGYIAGGTGTYIQNLGVKGSVSVSSGMVTGTCAGGIVGMNAGATTIQNCYTDVAVSLNAFDKGYAGGIAGNSNGDITNCYTRGNVTIIDDAAAGGIAGAAGGDVSYCFATGTVSGSRSGSVTNASNRCAGIVYESVAGKNVTNCIALNTGGITGTEGKTYRVVSGGNDLSRENYASPVIPGTWANTGQGNADGEDLTAANFTGAFAFTGWGDSWDFTAADNLPKLKTSTGAQLYGQSAMPARADYLRSTIRISNETELIAFRETVKNSNVTTGITAVLTKDIQLTEGSFWTPIGTSGKAFAGTFDGQGFCIRGLKIETTDATSDVYAGLFGYIDAGGTVKNLGVKQGGIDVETSMSAFAGGISGRNDGTINNCFTDIDIDVRTTSPGKYNVYAGGIVGRNISDISNCYALGDISSNYYTGGIAGRNTGSKTGGKITCCFATGKVEGPFAGGITNDMDNVINCIALNTGGITGSSNQTYRVRGSGTGIGNYASPLISGTWGYKGTDMQDGADLTNGNFTSDNATAFTGWDDNWDFTTAPTRLPKLMTTAKADGKRTAIAGQGDAYGDMKERSAFTPTRITTEVNYDAALHNNQLIDIANGGHFKVNVPNGKATFPGVNIAEGGKLTMGSSADSQKHSIGNLVIADGAQVFVTNAFDCKTLLSSPRKMDNRWVAYGNRFNMAAMSSKSTTFYTMTGYSAADADKQTWGPVQSRTTENAQIETLCLLALEDEADVFLYAMTSPGTTLTVPTEGVPTEGAGLHTGSFFFCANPTLHNVTIPMAYILSADGSRFERTENAVVKPFQSYMVANAVTSASVMSLRTGSGIPTANEQPTLPDGTFRVWGSNGQLHLVTDRASDVVIYNTAGRLVRRFTLTGEETLNLPRGIYLVHSNNITYKVSL